VQQRDEAQHQWLGQIERFRELRSAEDEVRLGDVRMDVGRAPFGGAGHQGAGVGEDDGVIVGVNDPGLGGHSLDDLVQVRLGGDTRADVEELPDPGFTGQPAAARCMKARVSRTVVTISGKTPSAASRSGG
jgi:hypothetical protein